MSRDGELFHLATELPMLRTRSGLAVGPHPVPKAFASLASRVELRRQYWSHTAVLHVHRVPGFATISDGHEGALGDRRAASLDESRQLLGHSQRVESRYSRPS